MRRWISPWTRRIIYDFAVNNRSSLGGKKYTQMLDFLMAHAQTVQENMVRKARIDAMAQPVNYRQPVGSRPTSARSPTAPNPSATNKQAGSQLP